MSAEGVTIAQTNINSMGKIDASASEQLRSQSTDGQYAMTVNSGDGPNDVETFFHNPTYRVQISVGVSTNAMLTVVRLFDTEGLPNF